MTKPATAKECAVTHAPLADGEGVYLFPAPDGGGWVIDFAEKLGKGGVYLLAQKEAIHTFLMQNGVADPQPWWEHVQAQVHKRLLQHISMARRASAVTQGHDKVVEALRTGKLAALIVAQGAGSDAKDMVYSAQKKGLPVLQCFSAAQIGHVCGRDHAVYLGLKKHGLSENFLKECRRLTGFL